MDIHSVSAQWAAAKQRKAAESAEFERTAAARTLSQPTPPLSGHLQHTTEQVLRHRVAAEPYWFHRIEVFPGFFTPGWSDPAIEKLPHYGLPEELAGKRVLDIGCAEGFFSFEAERRGAREVIAIDSSPDSVRRFNIVREARQSNATAYLTNVYDLDPLRFGTFDLVLFYGVFYHLKHPQLALERIKSVCAGTLLLQTLVDEHPAVKHQPWARFYPHGLMSGKNNENFDPTVFWAFNSTCVAAMLDHVGFGDISFVSEDPQAFVARCRVPEPRAGIPPNQAECPWN
jgi:tRNA (mo5U34)-methyltransferase